MISALMALPEAMRALPQWLLWRFKPRPGGGKPLKIPHYVSGQLRGWPNGRPRDGQPTAAQPQVAQGEALDRQALATFDQAVAKLGASAQWCGIGFAFLPGDGLVGVDIDHAVDPDTGEISDLCRSVVQMCGSYTERSVSGTGVHIICSGAPEAFKDDALGLEVYAQRQYFICTGQHWPGTPAEVRPMLPGVLAHLRCLVEESKARQAEAKVAQRAEAAATAPQATAPASSPTAPPAATGGDDFRRVNDAALAALHAWVPQLLPKARAWQAPDGWHGYRISSQELGRKLQEDLQFSPHGIMDFGEERGVSPIDCVMQWLPAARPKDALQWLATRLGMDLRRRSERPKPAAAALDERPEPPPEGDTPLSAKTRRRAPAQGEGAGPDDDDGDDAQPAKGRKRKLPREVWDEVHRLTARYALIYSTDTAWDRVDQKQVRIPALRLAWGKVPVNLWLASADRVMVRPEDIVFEPGEQVPEGQINSFTGLDLRPVPATAEEVSPMLTLLEHLCSESAPTDEGVAEVMHWVLCWQALPLQRIGAKMATALVFHGPQGTGKNLYWDAWRDIFGDHGVTVGQTEIEDKFNGWVSRKLAIIGDEVVSRQEMYHNKNRLKLVVTQHKKFPIRGMQQETRWESNHANVVFQSNESTPLALEDRDRRYLVVYTPLEADEALYESVRDFLRAGGLAKWMGYLQAYPLDGFHEHTKPLMTKAKEELIQASWRASVRFGHEWLGGYIDLPVRVCSAEQLYRAFRRWCDQAGEKWPPEQARFTAELNRWVKERVQRDPVTKRHEAPALVYKQVSLRAEVTQKRTTVRCWLPQGTGPLNGVTEGDWAWESVRTFEADLRRYCRRHGGDGADDGEGD